MGLHSMSTRNTIARNTMHRHLPCMQMVQAKAIQYVLWPRKKFDSISLLADMGV